MSVLLFLFDICCLVVVIISSTVFSQASDELWEVCQQAWELITPVEIEILFQTQKARMRQVVECNGRNDMPIPHEGIRERVLAEDALLKNTIPE